MVRLHPESIHPSKATYDPSCPLCVANGRAQRRRRPRPLQDAERLRRVAIELRAVAPGPDAILDRILGA